MIRPIISQGNDGSGSANRFRHMSGIYKIRMVADTIPETKPDTKETRRKCACYRQTGNNKRSAKVPQAGKADSLTGSSR